MKRFPITRVFHKFYLPILIISLLGCGERIANIDSPGQEVICFGDSITESVGASPGQDYPSLLARKINQPVINKGHWGDTTRDALNRLQADVLDRDPFLVIVQFNANDFLQKIPLSETFANLDKIVLAIKDKGAMVVLAEIRIGLIKDEYYEGFRDIANKYQAVLIPDIMKGILLNPQLKSDELHPNDKGYEIMVERIARRIEPLLSKRGKSPK